MTRPEDPTRLPCAAAMAVAASDGALPSNQGLTLVPVSAQREPFLSLKPAKHPTTWDNKVLTLS